MWFAGNKKNEPSQQRLARMIFGEAIYIVSYCTRGKALDLRHVLNLTKAAGWGERETKKRLRIAASMLKPLLDAYAYGTAKVIAIKLGDLYEVRVRHERCEHSVCDTEDHRPWQLQPSVRGVYRTS